MAHNRGGKIGQNVEALQIAGFGDGQQASRGQLALSASTPWKMAPSRRINTALPRVAATV